MPTFQQFELIDDFKKKDFEKLPHTLRLDKKIKEEGKLFRLLIGSLRIKNNVTDEIISQTTNYSILGRKENTRFSKKLFTSPFFANTRMKDIDEYFKKTKPKNFTLFRDLIYEYCNYFYFKSLGAHTLSFLYIYRILERMSYTFPMLYASKTDDYIGTFQTLQNYFKNSSPNSELKFFDLFINDYFESEFLEYKFRIDITAHNEDVREGYFKILKMLCEASKLEIKEANEFSDITIENRDTLGLIVCLRNRYFHFASGGQRNITSFELIDPNQFYGLLIDHFANWLAVVYFQIVKNEIK